MKNVADWIPSKFVIRDSKLRASRDTHEVTLSSRFVVDLVASYYDSYLKEHVRGRLIDLGCGKVPLYDAYKNHITENLCVDWPATLHKNPFLDYECDLNLPLPFPENEFHTVLLSDVLEHISNPQQLFHEMNRILVSGGKVILNVPFFYKLHEVPHDYYRYTKYALLKFAKDSKFDILILQEIGGLPEVLADLSSKLVFNIPIVGKFICRIFQTTSWLLMKTSLGKKLSAKTREHYPLGYFMILQK